MRIWSERRQNCSVYPAGRHQSYADCDTEFVRAELDRMQGSDYRPVWSSPDWAAASTNHTIPWNLVDWFHMKNLFQGVKTSPCRLPCTTFSVHTQLDVTNKNDDSLNVVDLVFLNSVRTTKTNFSFATFWQLLTFLGGNLGLWLGVSVVQILELVVRVPIKTFKG